MPRALSRREFPGLSVNTLSRAAGDTGAPEGPLLSVPPPRKAGVDAQGLGRHPDTGIASSCPSGADAVGPSAVAAAV